MEAYEITLAISEAAGNAIEHAYGPGDATFDLEVELEDGAVVACRRRPGRHGGRARDDHRGRGLRIIDGVMDSPEVTREEHGTLRAHAPATREAVPA